MLLVGDVGGTKTLLCTYSAQRGPREPFYEAVFKSADYPDLESLIREFLDRAQQANAGAEGITRVDRAILAVAGPVIGGRARITNLPWVLDQQRLETELELASVRLLNDLEALAWAVSYLGPGDLQTIGAGEPQPGGALAVIAAGTGLGQAFLTWDREGYLPHSSEGGHVDFGPTRPEEQELLSFLGRRFEHVSYERICSGIGLPNLYAFHKEARGLEEPAWLGELLAGVDDPTPVIVRAALDQTRPSRLCQAALETFVDVLGAAAGNLALTVFATGGVFVGGGIPPRILPLLVGDRFLRGFRNKGRMTGLLERVPVHVILDPKSALLGMSVRGLAG